MKRITGNLSVFLSHSSKDRSIVERVSEELRNMGLTPWLDDQQIVAGEQIPRKLSAALADSDYFLIFWSANAKSSRWVQLEIDAAFFQWADAQSILIIPVLLDNTDLPELLKPISHLDFRENIETGLTQLKAFFGREGFGPEQPPRLLETGPNCKDQLSALRNRDLRLLLKKRLGLNDVREIWIDTFESRLEDEFPNMPLGLSIGEMILRADERRLRDDLLESICANRSDVAN
ncbi:MAG: toll/interleukin-1 receptor domain-containing protein [Nitrosomonadaceae bacterium]|nr:toll/interleukin-1 receptor domain-containing protein [Nitrosomonadaceae bacterium]